tara:strand:+ start:3092 stop:3634 length:543 start_codon:yes stop_codon:yes gene_type:complete
MDLVTINCPFCAVKLSLPGNTSANTKMKCVQCEKSFLTPQLTGYSAVKPTGAPQLVAPPEGVPPKVVPRVSAPFNSPQYNVYVSSPQPENNTRADQRLLHPHRGGTILTLGILGLILIFPLGTAAWIMGASDLRKMNARIMDPAGREATYSGYICGILGTVFWMIVFIVVVLSQVPPQIR